MRREDQRLGFQQLVDIMPVIMEEDQDEDEVDSHFKNDPNPVRSMEMEEEHLAHFRNEVDSVTNLNMAADEHPANCNADNNGGKQRRCTLSG
jgi:hypothetical protein